MEYTFHYLLMANHSIFHRGVFSRMKDGELTSGQPKVLDYLKDHDGSSQKEVAGGCHIEPASLTVILNGMEEKGLVERRSMNGNRRTSYVFLTEKGREKLEKVDRTFAEMEETAFDGISEEEKKKFMELFVKIYDNMMREKE